MQIRKNRRYALMLQLAFGAGLLAGAAPAGQQPGVTRKIEVENEQVRVERVTIPLGFSSGMHSHELPGLEIFLTDDHIRETLADGSQREWRAKAGEVAWIAPVTHRVENLRSVPTEIISMEFKSLPPAALAAKSGEAVRELENEWVRVIHGRLEPGKRGPVHTHPNYIAVFLTDAKLRAHLADGTTRDIAGKRGLVQWREDVTHSVENLGDNTFEAIDVNLKPKAEGKK